jgi:hypothetical protein
MNSLFRTKVALILKFLHMKPFSGYELNIFGVQVFLEKQFCEALTNNFKHKTFANHSKTFLTKMRKKPSGSVFKPKKKKKKKFQQEREPLFDLLLA